MKQEILNNLPVDLLQQLNKELRKLYASAVPVFEDDIIDAIADVRHAIKSKVAQPAPLEFWPGKHYNLKSLEGNMLIGEYMYRELGDRHMFLIEGKQRVVHSDYIISSADVQK